MSVAGAPELKPVAEVLPFGLNPSPRKRMSPDDGLPNPEKTNCRPFGHGAVVAVAVSPWPIFTVPETSVIRDFLLFAQ